MTKEKINRINELARKSKTHKLSEQEQIEQKELRAEYIRDLKTNLTATLSSVVSDNKTIR